MWYLGVLKEDFLKADAGTSVAVTRSLFVHRGGYGDTWFVLTKDDQLYQVSEMYGGPNLRKLVRFAKDGNAVKSTKLPKYAHRAAAFTRLAQKAKYNPI